MYAQALTSHLTSATTAASKNPQLHGPLMWAIRNLSTSASCALNVPTYWAIVQRHLNLDIEAKQTDSSCIMDPLSIAHLTIVVLDQLWKIGDRTAELVSNFRDFDNVRA